MDRLTIRTSEIHVAYTQGKYKDTIPAEMTTDDIRKVLKKLAHYEDLEEQGLLLKLPCKVGDVVYCIEVKDCGHDWCSDICFECEYVSLEIREYAFNLRMIDDIGITVFLTLPEAEKALEEMKGE